MDEEQVELLEAEVLSVVSNDRRDVVGGVVGVGQLAGDVDLARGDPGVGDRPADALLGAVGLGGVDVAVAGLQAPG